MTTGKIYLASGILAITAVLGAIIYAIVTEDALPDPVSGISRLVVGGLTGLWLTNSGIAKIRRAKHESQTH